MEIGPETGYRVQSYSVGSGWAGAMKTEDGGSGAEKYNMLSAVESVGYQPLRASLVS